MHVEGLDRINYCLIIYIGLYLEPRVFPVFVHPEASRNLADSAGFLVEQFGIFGNGVLAMKANFLHRILRYLQSIGLPQSSRHQSAMDTCGPN